MNSSGKEWKVSLHFLFELKTKHSCVFQLFKWMFIGLHIWQKALWAKKCRRVDGTVHGTVSPFNCRGLGAISGSSSSVIQEAPSPCGFV